MAATKAMPAVPSVGAGNVIRVAFWIGVALVFGVWVAVARGATAAAEYYAAYLLELSLSVDNIFVFVVVFSELHIPAENQRRVLAWGVTGALVFRAVMITAGIALIQRFEWIMYPFGALILFAAWRMLFAAERERRVVAGACDVCNTWIARVVRVSDAFDRLRYLRQGLAAVLLFTGAKMIGSEWVHISPGVSVSIIALVLGLTIAMSMWPRRIRETVPLEGDL